MDARTSHPLPTLMSDVQTLFEEMLLSLLSETTLVIASTHPASCDKTRVINTYRYYKRWLWIGYAAVIAVTFLFVLVGAW